MQTLDVIQGSDGWHDARAKYRRTASLAPAVMGASKKKTRTEAIAFLATGMEKEFSQWARENLLDRGHLIESFARPMAEKIIGKKLYPVTAISDDEYLLASYDGLSADDSDAWECKSWNEKKAEDVRNGIIPDEDFWQVVQQLAIGAKRCLYMVTDGTEERTEYCWLLRDEVEEEIERLISGWNQADKDVANYQHIEHAEKPKAEAIMDLPALAVQATGMVTYSNLPEFKAAAESYIASINTDLQTDQQFADAEATVKFCKSTEETLEVTKKAILAQTATIDEVIRTVDHIQAQLRDKRLMLDKLVKSEKEARKIALVSSVSGQFADHVAGLQAEIAGIRLSMLIVSPDFGAVIKGLKSLASMHDALDTALANAKIEADAVAKDIRAKLAWCKETAASHSAIFPDLQSLIAKPMEDFTLTIATRIKEFHEREQAKLEAARAKGEADAKAKAEAAALAELVAKEDQIRAEERAKNNPPQSQASTLAGAQSETAALVAKPDNVVVIEHQDAIGAFLASRDFGKEAGRIRAIIIEYVKFEEQFKRKLAA